MREVYRIQELDELTGHQALYGVIGFPVAHSRSPAMHRAAFQAAGMSAEYVRVEVPPDQVPEAVEKMRALPFLGWNATLPHKPALLPLMDVLGDSARRLGGVNTVVHEEGRLTGFNTDGDGWVRAVRESFGLDVRDLRIMILGCGGAGAALARQATLEGCARLVLANRSVEKARQLAAELKPFFDRETLRGAHESLVAVDLQDVTVLARELDAVDLVVNGTSLGLKLTDPPPIPSSLLQPHLCIYDTIYRNTSFQQSSRAAGCRVANGLSMLLHQGALSWELWTGREAPLEAMRDGLNETS
ncbi:MAG: shikimate dehydrogenase [Candidatus Methylacidiphilales bacterium]